MTDHIRDIEIRVTTHGGKLLRECWAQSKYEAEHLRLTQEDVLRMRLAESTEYIVQGFRDLSMLRCMHAELGVCEGPVTFWMGMAPNGTNKPRCAKHWEELLARHEEVERT